MFYGTKVLKAKSWRHGNDARPGDFPLDKYFHLKRGDWQLTYGAVLAHKFDSLSLSQRLHLIECCVNKSDGGVISIKSHSTELELNSSIFITVLHGDRKNAQCVKQGCVAGRIKVAITFPSHRVLLVHFLSPVISLHSLLSRQQMCKLFVGNLESSSFSLLNWGRDDPMYKRSDWEKLNDLHKDCELRLSLVTK